MTDKKTATLLIKLSPDLRAEFQAYAARHGQNMSELLRHLMTNELRGGQLVNSLKPEIFKGLYDQPTVEVTADSGKAYQIQVVPFRSNTTLQIYDPDAEYGFFDISTARGGSALLDRFFAVFDTNYTWETPSYQAICSELGLDPDYGRPFFATCDEDLVAELREHIAWGQSGDAMKLNELIFDLIDMLRTNTFPEFYAYERSRATLENWTFRTPKATFLSAFERVDVQRIQSSKPIFTSVDFLPSWAGTGYSASIDLYGEPECADDGWPKQSYHHVNGVALQPSRIDLAMQTVVDRLAAQGVVFLSASEARDYMDNEGAYWAATRTWCNCPQNLQPRTPTAAEKLKWHLKKPPLPLYEEFLKRSPECPTNI